jgi:hypothetical protein
MTQDNPSDSAPKLIVDTDWKSQAQAEKQRLADAAAKAAPAAKSAPAGIAASGAGNAEGEAAQGEGAPREEKIGIQDVVSLLVTNALSYMGAFADPQTGRAVVAPDMAKVYIDMLGVLEDKTKGNLSDQESQILTQTLSELRLEYVELAKAIERAVAEGKIKPQQMGGGMGAMGGGMGGPGLAGPGLAGPGMGGMGGMGGGMGVSRGPGF